VEGVDLTKRNACDQKEARKSVNKPAVTKPLVQPPRWLQGISFFFNLPTHSVLFFEGSFGNKPQRRRSFLSSCLVAHILNLILVTNPACFPFSTSVATESNLPQKANHPVTFGGPP
jgi:hypothetical protein